MKCGDCPNQAFVSVSDQTVVDHLQGRHVMGVYPLLQDETCWFLAVDFDKRSWMDDVAAFVETCRDVGVPAAVERSRSGNGAHVWFFFTAPVAAGIARKMGCYLITETMARRHQLSMESYDRLFPSQDTMPRGGFGNLIALPLQHEARQQGNTVFLDDQFNPHPDQWAYLAGVERIGPATVERIAAEATRKGQVIGVRSADPGDDEEDRAPWTRSPSGAYAAQRKFPGRCHASVRRFSAQRVFVEKAGSAVGAAEPDQAAGRVPESGVLQEAEHAPVDGADAARDCLRGGVAGARRLPARLPCGPRRLSASTASPSLSMTSELRAIRWRSDFSGQLTPVQQSAASALLAHDIGVFVAPPGVGKTVVGTYLVAQRACSTLVLVHRQPLLDQWVAQLSMFLGIDPQGHRPNRRREAKAQRPSRRRDAPEPRAWRRGE